MCLNWPWSISIYLRDQLSQIGLLASPCHQAQTALNLTCLQCAQGSSSSLDYEDYMGSDTTCHSPWEVNHAALVILAE